MRKEPAGSGGSGALKTHCGVAPCVICVRAKLGAIFAIDRDDVALEVLFKEIAVEHAMRIGWL